MAGTTKRQQLFNGRDASWMQFNRRVLEEAGDPANPLLERVKFLAITGSNLDEYVATGSPATIACAPTNP